MSDHTPVVIKRTKLADDTKINPLAPSACQGCTNTECNSAQADDDAPQGVDQDGVNEADEEETEAFPALRILTNVVITIGAALLICLSWWAFRAFTR
jgi:hypothetical protein